MDITYSNKPQLKPEGSPVVDEGHEDPPPLFFSQQEINKLACDILTLTMKATDDRGLRVYSRPMNLYLTMTIAADRLALEALEKATGRACKVLEL